MHQVMKLLTPGPSAASNACTAGEFGGSCVGAMAVCVVAAAVLGASAFDSVLAVVVVIVVVGGDPNSAFTIFFSLHSFSNICKVA